MLFTIVIIFIAGYLAIAFEHGLKLNKAASALVTGGLCWTLYILSDHSEQHSHRVTEQLYEHLGDISGILFFLLGAMTIVELIDAHNGFDLITAAIKTRRKRKLLVIVSLITFVLSAVLDNLTTTIVMVSLSKKLLQDKNARLLFIGMIVISANAGGAWSPIGDVTTTMLWIGGQVTTQTVIVNLILPSLVCLFVPLTIMTLMVKGDIEQQNTEPDRGISKRSRNIIFFSGVTILLLVPVFKVVTHLPPFMGMLIGLGILWLISEIVHHKKDEEDRDKLSVVSALQKIDTPSILFFLGILISIAALESSGYLAQLARLMDSKIGDVDLIVLSIGLLSAIVDNVPLVAGAMGMYDLHTYATDHYFWQFLAYCAGTGGSALIIGSAAGVAAMGMENINFFWYVKRISWLAIIGYLAGALVFISLH